MAPGVLVTMRPARIFSESPHTREIQMFVAIAVVLLIMWLLGFVAFHVAGGLIHLLLIVALISVVIHFVRGR